MLADLIYCKSIRGITQQAYKTRTDSIQYDVKDEVGELKECAKKLEGELDPSKNTSELSRLVSMGRPCWANAHYSRYKCAEVTGIVKSVSASDLEDTFLKFWRKLG